MIYTSWIAYLTFALVVFLLLPSATLSRSKQAGLLALCLIVGAVPLPTGLSLAGYLRAITDDVAISSLVWLGLASLARLQLISRPLAAHKMQALVVFVLIGVVLYPAALGVGMFDPYRVGYTPQWIILAIGVICIAAVTAGNLLLTTTLAIATLAYGFGVKNSVNYWDYIVDPFIVIYAVGALVKLAMTRGRVKQVPKAASI